MRNVVSDVSLEVAHRVVGFTSRYHKIDLLATQPKSGKQGTVDLLLTDDALSNITYHNIQNFAIGVIWGLQDGKV